MMGQNGERCADGACVHVKVIPEGVRVMSTIEDNDGVVVFTQAEWTTFLDEVKAGKWDHTA